MSERQIVDIATGKGDEIFDAPAARTHRCCLVVTRQLTSQSVLSVVSCRSGDAVEERCVSIAGKSRVLHLETRSEEELFVLLAALKQLLLEDPAAARPPKPVPRTPHSESLPLVLLF